MSAKPNGGSAKVHVQATASPGPIATPLPVVTMFFGTVEELEYSDHSQYAIIRASRCQKAVPADGNGKQRLPPLNESVLIFVTADLLNENNNWRCMWGLKGGVDFQISAKEVKVDKKNVWHAVGLQLMDIFDEAFCNEHMEKIPIYYYKKVQ